MSELRTNAAPAEEPMPDEVWLHAMARDVPGFGGAFFDEDENLVVLLNDVSHAGAARMRLAQHLPPQARGRAGTARVRSARFTFEELAGWRNRLIDPISEVPGASFLDLDERVNRVVLGVTRASAVGQARALAARMGIPGDAIEVILTDGEVEPVEPELPLPSLQSGTGANLGQMFRPLTGGINIGRRSSNADTYHRCTLGFLAELDGLPVFITNSHCSSKLWDTDASIFHQPFPDRTSEFFRIGQEYRDKRGVSCGFLSINVCRYSDATAVAVWPGTEGDRGTIARTMFADSSSAGSRDIDPVNPRFTIIGKGNPVMNQPLEKMGAATGWTRGRVTRSCVVTVQVGRNHSRLRCQSFVRAEVQVGDSGAPVFFDHGGGQVTLMGILWARKGPACDPLAGYCDPTVEFVFSPIAGIETDLGTLHVEATPVWNPGGPSNNCGPGNDPTAVIEPC